MTSSFLPSRALTLRFLPRAATATPVFSSIRVRHEQNAQQPASSSACNATSKSSRLSRSRYYATATTASRPGRPKAHTGRATASKRRATASTSTTGTTTKRTAAAKKPAAKKATKATPKRKTKAKAKPKPKPRRRVLTEKQKADKEKKAAGQKVTGIRKTALLSPPSAKAPKQLPSTAYLVSSTENFSKGTDIAANARANADRYKNLTLEDREVRPGHSSTDYTTILTLLALEPHRQ